MSGSSVKTQHVSKSGTVKRAKCHVRCPTIKDGTTANYCLRCRHGPRMFYFIVSFLLDFSSSYSMQFPSENCTRFSSLYTETSAIELETLTKRAIDTLAFRSEIGPQTKHHSLFYYTSAPKSHRPAILSDKGDGLKRTLSGAICTLPLRATQRALDNYTRERSPSTTHRVSSRKKMQNLVVRVTPWYGGYIRWRTPHL